MSAVKIFAVVALLGVFAVFGVALGALNFFNTSTTLITQYEAKTDANKADFDNTWKTISQVAQVPSKYKEDFEGVYKTYMESRKGGNTGDGAMLSFLSEAVPHYDAQALYAKVQVVVESKRESWTMRQKELRDLKRAHDTLVRTFPGVMYNVVIGHDELEAIMITSTKTEKTFATGLDENTDLF